MSRYATYTLDQLRDSRSKLIAASMNPRCANVSHVERYLDEITSELVSRTRRYECPTCRGRREIERGAVPSMGGIGGFVMQYERCPSCSGKGDVTAIQLAEEIS